MQTFQIPPGLASIARNRDYIHTHEFAETLGKASQSARKLYCQTGEAWGVRPVKVGHHLMWPVAEIAKVLIGGAQR